MKKLCLLIDLDNTLFDSEAAYAYALKSVGIDSVSSEFVQARQTVKARLGEGHVAARNRILYFKSFLERRSQYSPIAVLELMEAYEKNLSDHIKNQWNLLERKRLFEGLLASIPKVMVTNENLRTQMIKLRAIDPDGTIFPHVITSEEMGVEKPHLSIFERALNILGCLPSECLMVGDSVDLDISPAQKMGMRTLLTTEFKQLKSDESIPKEIQIIGRLNELEKLFL